MCNQAIEAAPGLYISEHDGGITIFDTITDRIFVSNRVGARIWAGLTAGMSADQIATQIADSFCVSHERALQETRLFLSELEQQRLVTRRPA